jgi:hypothetical protein
MYPPPFRKEWGRGRLARGFSQVQQFLSSSASGGLVDYVAGCGLVVRRQLSLLRVLSQLACSSSFKLPSCHDELLALGSGEVRLSI